MRFYQSLKEVSLKVKGTGNAYEKKGEDKALGIDSSVLANVKEFSSDYSVKEKLQREIWERYLNEHKGLNIELLKTKELQTMVYAGIPDCYRGTYLLSFSRK